MDLKVILHRRAERDLQDIHDYLLSAAGAKAADRVRVHLRRKIGLLARSPHLGRPTSNPDIRLLAPTRYPYRVYYTLTDAAVIVLHIRHSARRDLDPDDLR
jgi:plasmid stabilization system protein ParE